MYIEKHFIGLTGRNRQPIISAPYQAGPKAGALMDVEVDEIILQKVIEPAQTVWAVAVGFALRKDESLRFYVVKKTLVLWVNMICTQYV